MNAKLHTKPTMTRGCARSLLNLSVPAKMNAMPATAISEPAKMNALTSKNLSLDVKEISMNAVLTSAQR